MNVGTQSNDQNATTNLPSNLQGFLNALQRITRSLEKANHHRDLLTTAVDNNRPVRGLIPKVVPRIPDTPTDFIIKWIDTLQETGLELTKQLKAYWSDRSAKLQADLQALKTRAQAAATAEQWNAMAEIIDETQREAVQEARRRRPRQNTNTGGNQTNNQTPGNLGQQPRATPGTSQTGSNQGNQPLPRRVATAASRTNLTTTPTQ